MTLDKHLECNKDLRSDDRLAIGIKIATILVALHGRSIVHRDLKPANIVVSDNGEITIIDFGLARIAQNGVVRTEHTKDGTRRYASLEQLKGSTITPKSDVASFGFMLPWLLAGVEWVLTQDQKRNPASSFPTSNSLSGPCNKHWDSSEISS